MASDSLKRLRDDTEGAAFLEFTVFAMFFFTLLFGIVEFTLAYYQWNAGTKAVQLGARLAAVSNPVSDELAVPSWDLADYAPGEIVAIDDGFTIVCTGADG
jgi:Flp pilus assembly protein TadG